MDTGRFEMSHRRLITANATLIETVAHGLPIVGRIFPLSGETVGPGTLPAIISMLVNPEMIAPAPHGHAVSLLGTHQAPTHNVDANLPARRRTYHRILCF
jgi:hypothetical protein